VVRTLCLLVLDRFGDYSASKASAPGREAAAQLLQELAGNLDFISRRKVVVQLLRVSGMDSWHVRHGAWLAMETMLW